MVVVIVAAAVYSAVQVAVPGWAARSVRLRTVLIAVPAVVVAAVPVTVRVAAYSVDPAIEELVKVGVVAAVWWAVARVRRQWGLTDVVVVT